MKLLLGNPWKGGYYKSTAGKVDITEIGLPVESDYVSVDTQPRPLDIDSPMKEYIFIDGIMSEFLSLSFEKDEELYPLHLAYLGVGSMHLQVENGLFQFETRLDERDDTLDIVCFHYDMENLSEYQILLENIYHKLHPQFRRMEWRLLSPSQDALESQAIYESMHQYREKMENEHLGILLEKYATASPPPMILVDGYIIPPMKIAHWDKIASTIPVVGLVKQNKKWYIENPRQNLKRTQVGKIRTGLRRIDREDGSYYTSYIRLIENDHMDIQDQVIRVEMSAHMSLDLVKKYFADLVELLPQCVYRYSPRYPQGLGAVEFLENRLKSSVGGSDNLNRLWRYELYHKYPFLVFYD